MERLDTGAAVGPYRIDLLIGAGGMGEVYRAHDPRIARDVAIKVLPSAYAADADRLRRFQQEARASGALNHPNVATLYDVGTAEGRPYLVMELLDGETLRERLGRGALPTARACELAAAIAHGLAAAHAKGIVHRDLKPENVIVTRDGRVKVLDFGIAKLRDPEPDPDAGTVTTPLRTAAETVLGTAGYMAPEQVRGAVADARADLFALGAILYELLTGRRAFECRSRVETLHAVLHDDPPALGGSVPTAVDRIVRRCLEKDPEARFQSALDLAFALDTAAGGTAIAADNGPAGSMRRTIPIRTALAIGLVLPVVSALAVWMWKPGPAPAGAARTAALTRFAIQPPPGLTFGGQPAISPDGTLLVYRGGPQSGDRRSLFLRRLDQLTNVEMPGTEGGYAPFFSPDGKTVGFGGADGKLKRIGIEATALPSLVCDAETFLSGTWLANGTIVFSSIRHGLRRVAAAGGAPEIIMPLDASRPEIDHHSPWILPGGKALLFAVHAGERKFRIGALVLATGERKVLIEGGFNPQYSPTGHLVYATAEGVFAVPFDPERLALAGAPFKVIDGVATDPHNGVGNFSLSTTGTIVFEPKRPQARRTLAWLNRAGMSTPLPVEPRTFLAPRLSPDGRQIAVVVDEQDRQNIWMYRLDTRMMAPVTFEGRNHSPVWTRDGAHLAFAAERGDVRHVMWQPLDASTNAESLIASENTLIPGGWSADGGSLIYWDDPPTDNSELRVLTIDGRRSALLPDVGFRSMFPTVSPDGRWLTYASLAGGRPGIYVQPFPGPGPRRQLVDSGTEPVWSHDGRELFFRARRGAPPASAGLPPGDGIFALPFDPSRGAASAPEVQLFRARIADSEGGGPSFDVSSDGRRFLVVLSDDAEFTPTEFHVILHIDAQLLERVR